MGENEIYATLPPETLTADIAAGEAATAQGEIAAKRQKRDAQVAQEQEKSNQAIEQLKQENSAQQEAERGKAQGAVEQLRGEWTQEQDTLIEAAQTEAERLRWALLT